MKWGQEVELYMFKMQHMQQSVLLGKQESRHNFPSLLIELAGPTRSLSGAVSSNVVMCDPLTPMVSLLW